MTYTFKDVHYESWKRNCAVITGAKMEFLFYIEGLNREVWQAGASRKFARAALWASLTDAEQNAVVQIECIDEREAKPPEGKRTMERIEITGAALIERHNDISVFIGNVARKYGASFAGLSRQYRNHIEANGLGASDVPEGEIRTDDGRVLAVISYNGRVWAA